ncbi:hypothetical protein [[Phormidium] sp. ETS-05]|uniref:hypothetical protein n=1 Tax=[Phormidium] sp. ETS-05 TaxID=222819 RepID=UPI0018EF3194|nr:hypothetical protein [[Phormidium] sp. ETS-05]
MVKLQGLLSDRSKIPVMWTMDPITPAATHAQGGLGFDRGATRLRHPQPQQPSPIPLGPK